MNYYWAYNLARMKLIGESSRLYIFCPPCNLRYTPAMHDIPHTHVETHFQSSESVRDVVIGMSDGLTVPFALAAGLSGAVAVRVTSSCTAGLAEIAAGSIAMGLGGYLAARSDAEHYASELKRASRTRSSARPEDEAEEIYRIFDQYGCPDAMPPRPSSPRSSRTTPPGSTS